MFQRQFKFSRERISRAKGERERIAELQDFIGEGLPLGETTCQACMYFVRKETEFTRCRRHAPTFNGYPFVHPNDWCGDYKPREEKAFCAPGEHTLKGQTHE